MFTLFVVILLGGFVAGEIPMTRQSLIIAAALGLAGAAAGRLRVPGAGLCALQDVPVAALAAWRRDSDRGPGALPCPGACCRWRARLPPPPPAAIGVYPHRGRAWLVAGTRHLYHGRDRGRSRRRTCSNQIMAAPLIRCDEVAWAFLGLSMASWNALISVGLAALWLLAARRRLTYFFGWEISAPEAPARQAAPPDDTQPARTRDARKVCRGSASIPGHALSVRAPPSAPWDQALSRCRSRRISDEVSQRPPPSFCTSL